MAWLGKPIVEVYNDIYVKHLPLNYAFVILNTTLEGLGVYSVREDCYRCPYKRMTDSYNAVGVDAVYEVFTGATRWRILNHNNGDYIQEDYKRGWMCEMKPTLGEFGVYRLDVGRCVMETVVPPVDVYLPLLFFALIMLSAITSLGLVKLFLRRRNKARYNDGPNLTAKRDNSDIMPSLHFLRGILLMIIIFVTSGGGGYPIFSKSYGGLTVTNCLLFAFTLTIGLKIPMFEKDYGRLMSKWSTLFTIFLRSFVLLIFGFAISETAPRSRFLAAQLWAPLECIAVSYLVVAIAYMISAIKRTKPKNTTVVLGSVFWSWFVGAFFVIIMILSVHVFYYTECKEYTDFDPQRNSWMASGNNCQEDDTFSEVFNKILLGVNRDEPFYVNYYYAFTKGLLGVISTILAALVGLKAGVIYVQYEDHSNKLKQWFFLAAMSGTAGIIFAALSSPLNINLWPIAVIFLISSVTLFFYTCIYYIIEVQQGSSDVITACGVASIPTLSGHFLFSQNFPFYWGVVLDTHFIYLWQSTWIVGLWIVVTICWMKWRTFLISKMVSHEGTKRTILAW